MAIGHGQVVKSHLKKVLSDSYQLTEISSCVVTLIKKTFFFWNMRDLLCKAKSEGGRGRWGLPQRLNIILLRKMHSSYDYQLYKISFWLYVLRLKIWSGWLYAAEFTLWFCVDCVLKIIIFLLFYHSRSMDAEGVLAKRVNLFVTLWKSWLAWFL